MASLGNSLLLFEGTWGPSIRSGLKIKFLNHVYIYSCFLVGFSLTDNVEFCVSHSWSADSRLLLSGSKDSTLKVSYDIIT